MNYKLAKQLKDAGFPQDTPSVAHPFLMAIGNDAICYTPSLSELIEACGDEFAKLVRIEGNIGNVAFVAYELGNKVGISGKTPEEAVARLWLELNKYCPNCGMDRII